MSHDRDLTVSAPLRHQSTPIRGLFTWHMDLSRVAYRCIVGRLYSSPECRRWILIGR
uniref:Uncharacterized protein n=1 Tax=Anguilla anguilla TaxID=7936 RepID=A0A0E9QSK7_ANGAN